MTPLLLLIALALLGFGLLSGRAERSVLTAPMAFVALGYLAARSGVHALEVELEEHAIHTLAELTLVLILFTDATRIDLRSLLHDRALPLRLLLIGMPLTIVLGAAAAHLVFPSLTVFTAAVLATVLAPTDAALGQAVVGNESVPASIRRALNVESGLNDGLALPALLVFMSICAMGRSETPGYWVRFAFLQVTLGPLVGAACGFVGGRLIERASTTGWMNHVFQELSALSLSLASFALAELVGGNGFIAAFVAGLVLGHSSPRICSCLAEFAEAEGQLLALLVFGAFGAVMLPSALAAATPAMWLYAVLSLTVVRIVPVALALTGAGVGPAGALFMGWFGPRGLASILFALLVLRETMVGEAALVVHVAYLTVLLSVFAHGMTAFPWARAFGARAAG